MSLVRYKFGAFGCIWLFAGVWFDLDVVLGFAWSVAGFVSSVFWLGLMVECVGSCVFAWLLCLL